MDIGTSFILTAKRWLENGHVFTECSRPSVYHVSSCRYHCEEEMQLQLRDEQRRPREAGITSAGTQASVQETGLPVITTLGKCQV